MTLQAYQRVKSRKSKVASGVLEAVKKFFEKDEFANKPHEIRDYAHWALKPDGPAYYKVPTPKSCKVDRNHPDYVVSFSFTVLCSIHALKTSIVS
jgi:hypothetical protein